MGMQSSEKTDGLRRLALQLALQLPESVEDARRVLAMTGECLDQFLIEQSGSLSAWQRAKRLGWRVDVAAENRPGLAAAEASPSVSRALCWALATLGVTAPLALLLVNTVGGGAGFCFGFAVILISVVFGVLPALALAGASPIIHNLVVVPPAFALQVPSKQELVWAVFYVFFALSVPPLLRRLNHLRRLAARPLKGDG